jgi:signal transduction histidine kinase
MLGSLLPPDEHPAAHRTVARIDRTAQRMHRLIQDLLDVTRLDGAPFAVHAQPVDPGVLFEEAEAMLQPLADAHGVTLEFAGPTGLPHIAADGARLIQVFSNLVGNALKFTGPGGRVRVTWRGEEDELRVAVADSGPGIAEERMAQLLGGFWERRTVRNEGGLGLGLAITRSIVEAHGGTIRIESRPGDGTTVHFTVPLHAQPALLP